MNFLVKVFTVVGKMGLGLGVLYLLFIVGVAIDKRTTITSGDVAAMLFLIVGSYAIGALIFKGLDFLFDKFYKPRFEAKYEQEEEELTGEYNSLYHREYHPIMLVNQPLSDEEVKKYRRWWEENFGDDEDLGDDEDYYDDFGNPT